MDADFSRFHRLVVVDDDVVYGDVVAAVAIECVSAFIRSIGCRQRRRHSTVVG